MMGETNLAQTKQESTGLLRRGYVFTRLAGLDTVAFDHPGHRAAINTHDVSRTRAACPHRPEYIEEVATLKFIERRQVCESRLKPVLPLVSPVMLEDLLGQIFRRDDQPARVDRRMLKCVLKLTHIARPVVSLQQTQG